MIRVWLYLTFPTQNKTELAAVLLSKDIFNYFRYFFRIHSYPASLFNDEIVIMKQLSNKLVKSYKSIGFYCRACDSMHLLRLEPFVTNGPFWSWDNNVEKPTFTPSAKFTLKQVEKDYCCHFTVTDGRITYLGDCTHEYVNHTIEIPDLPRQIIDDYCIAEMDKDAFNKDEISRVKS